MLLSRQILPDDIRQKYKESCYDIIGCIHYVHKTLGPAMVEYVYQEALYKTLLKKGYNVIKEYNHHPVFDGQPLKSSIQMDMVVFRPEGNVIIECKSIADIGDREQMQTFGYMCGTQFPYAIIANFGTYPKAQVERYHFENNSINAF